MREFFHNLRFNKWFWLGLIIICQSLIYILAGANKSYLHMDEAYSYGLTNYDQVEIGNAPDFYDTWHSGEYYEDYLIVNEDERGDYSPVYNNQRDDVHPPLFYLLLRFAMSFTSGHFSVWPGITLNILAAAITTIFVFLITSRLFGKEGKSFTLPLIVTLLTALTVATLDTVLYIRMYCLLTMWVTITTYLHIKLLETQRINWKLLTAIGIVALAGVLTQYYYLFYLVALYIFFAVRYIRARRWHELSAYTGALAIAGVLSLIIWPYSIQHMFFGYRGQGVLSNFADPSGLALHIGIYTWLLNQFTFHGILPLVIIALMVLMLYGLLRQKSLRIPEEQRRIFAMIFTAAIVYFLIAAIASPYQDLRYIMAICGMSFLLVSYGTYKLIGLFWQGKTLNIILSVIAIIFLSIPIIANIRPAMLYSERTEIVNRIEENSDIPAIYIFDSSDNRFLDDILLFSKLQHSYIAKDLTLSDSNIKSIFQDVDLSRGLFVVINNGQDNATILENLSIATDLPNIEWLTALFAAHVYYLSK